MGQRLGAYELEAELGRGGFGCVFRARHLPTGAARAVKVLESVPDVATMDRFRREAAALARLGGKGVVGIHELAQEGNRFFIAMELAPGGTLQDRLRARGKLEPGEAARLVAGLARTIERVHAVGLVHRDLKPANVLFDEQGEARLADFGCVRDLGASRLTASGTVLGTPAYSSPEQLAGEPAGPPTDVFALGAILHELLTGRRPFEGRTSFELASAALARQRTPTTREGAPAELEATVARCLDPRAAARPSAGELAAALEAFTRSPVGRSASPSRAIHSLVVALVLGAVLLAVAVGVALSAGRGTHAERSREATAPSPPPPPVAAESSAVHVPGAPRRALPRPTLVAQITSFVQGVIAPEALSSGAEVTLDGRGTSLRVDLQDLLAADPNAYAEAMAPIVSAAKYLMRASQAHEAAIPGMLSDANEIPRRRRILEQAFGADVSGAPAHVRAARDSLVLLDASRLTRSIEAMSADAEALVARDRPYGAALLALIGKTCVLTGELQQRPELAAQLIAMLERAATLALSEASLGPGEPLAAEEIAPVSRWARWVARDARASQGDAEEILASQGDVEAHLERAAAAWTSASELARAWRDEVAGDDRVRAIRALFMLEGHRSEEVLHHCDEELLARIEKIAPDLSGDRTRVVLAEVARRRGQVKQARDLARPGLGSDKGDISACARAIFLLTAEDATEREAERAALSSVAESAPSLIGWYRSELLRR
jgi:hypothetical protein